jgi:hypothetical protein
VITYLSWRQPEPGNITVNWDTQNNTELKKEFLMNLKASLSEGQHNSQQKCSLKCFSCELISTMYMVLLQILYPKSGPFNSYVSYRSLNSFRVNYSRG